MFDMIVRVHTMSNLNCAYRPNKKHFNLIFNGRTEVELKLWITLNPICLPMRAYSRLSWKLWLAKLILHSLPIYSPARPPLIPACCLPVRLWTGGATKHTRPLICRHIWTANQWPLLVPPQQVGRKFIVYQHAWELIKSNRANFDSSNKVSATFSN